MRGERWTDEQIAGATAESRPALTFNRIRPLVTPLKLIEEAAARDVRETGRRIPVLDGAPRP